jgi:hypothetical protein
MVEQLVDLERATQHEYVVLPTCDPSLQTVRVNVRERHGLSCLVEELFETIRERAGGRRPLWRS